jgi:hypothetical protein
MFQIIPVMIMILTTALTTSKVFILKRKLNKDKRLSRREYNFALSSIILVVFFMICCLPYFMNVIATIYFFLKQERTHIVSLLEEAYASTLATIICVLFRFSFSFIVHLCFNVLYNSEFISLFRIKRFFFKIRLI